MFDSAVIEFENSIRKSLKELKKDLIVCYAVLTVMELIILYFIVRLL